MLVGVEVAVGATVGDGDGVGVGVGLTVGAGAGVGEAVGFGVAVVVGAGVGLGLSVGAGKGIGVGVTVGWPLVGLEPGGSLDGLELPPDWHAAAETANNTHTTTIHNLFPFIPPPRGHKSDSLHKTTTGLKPAFQFFRGGNLSNFNTLHSL